MFSRGNVSTKSPYVALCAISGAMNSPYGAVTAPYGAKSSARRRCYIINRWLSPRDAGLLQLDPPTSAETDGTIHTGRAPGQSPSFGRLAIPPLCEPQFTQGALQCWGAYFWQQFWMVALSGLPFSGPGNHRFLRWIADLDCRAPFWLMADQEIFWLSSDTILRV